MVLLECTVHVLDPMGRRLPLAFTGRDRSDQWQPLVMGTGGGAGDGGCTLMMKGTWLELMKPVTGTLAQLDALGLVDATTGRPWPTLSEQEYHRQIMKTCVIL